jgi:hypothetical protein
MAGKNTTHGTTSAGSVTEVDLTRYHSAVEVISRGAGDFWVSTDPANVNPAANADDVEWIGANSSNTIPVLAPRPDQGQGADPSVGTKVYIFCTAAVSFTVNGR